MLRDPRAERQAIDFYEFISNMDADALLYFARIVREATAGQVAGGHVLRLSHRPRINQQDSGHLAVRRVFDSPDIDFLMSPPNYWYRKPGGGLHVHVGHRFAPAARQALARRIGPPHAPDRPGRRLRPGATPWTKRWACSGANSPRCSPSGPPSVGSTWAAAGSRDPQVLAAMGQAGGSCARACHAPAVRAEIGVFVDPQSFYWMRPTMANSALVLNQVVTMPQSGAPWDFCLLDDIADPWLPDYKLYVFLNAFYVDPAAARGDPRQAQAQRRHRAIRLRARLPRPRGGIAGRHPLADRHSCCQG